MRYSSIQSIIVLFVITIHHTSVRKGSSTTAVPGPGLLYGREDAPSFTAEDRPSTHANGYGTALQNGLEHNLMAQRQN